MSHKKGLVIAIIMTSGFVILTVGVFVYEWLNPSFEDTEFTELQKSVFKALVDKADTKISDLACEINGTRSNPDGTTNYNDVTVGDFIASFLAWNMAPAVSDFQEFGCDGTQIMKCYWQYGQRKTSEGWDRILQFEYDANLKTINTETIKCIDIP